MKVYELVELLKLVDQDADVLIPDSHYGEEGTLSELEAIRTSREYTTLSIVELGFK